MTHGVHGPPDGTKPQPVLNLKNKPEAVSRSHCCSLKCGCLKPREGQKDCSACRLGRQGKLRPDLLFLWDNGHNLRKIQGHDKTQMLSNGLGPGPHKTQSILRRQTAAHWQLVLGHAKVTVHSDSRGPGGTFVVSRTLKARTHNNK